MPLTGLKVLDLTRFIAGPICTMLLADMGADVIKIEPLGRGDESRHQGSIIEGESWYFVGMNRNKRGMTLNLKSDEGREIFLTLARGADVVVENFRPDVMPKLGLGYDTLSGINPSLIYCAISGFGKSGPKHLLPAFDLIAQGMSGFMSVTGYPDRMPLRAGISIADSIAGMYAAYGILLAVIARHRTGRGQEVNTSLLEGLISHLSYHAGRYLGLGEVPGPQGNDHPMLSPYGAFKAQDGYIIIAPSGH